MSVTKCISFCFDFDPLEGVLRLSLSLSVSIFLCVHLTASSRRDDSQYTIRIKLLIWRQILGDGEECTVLDHFAH